MSDAQKKVNVITAKNAENARVGEESPSITEPLHLGWRGYGRNSLATKDTHWSR
jgi:hypothetical protein